MRVFPAGPVTTSQRRRGGQLRFRSVARVMLPTALSTALAIASAQTAGDAAQRSDVIAQKTRLVEQFLRSPRAAAVASGSDQAAKALLSHADALLTQSRRAATPAEAERHLNDALRAASEALRLRPGETDSTLARRNDELRLQIADYRAALLAIGSARRAQALEPLAAIDALLAEAQTLSAGGRHAEANGPLTRAYDISARALAAARAGETVTIELKFATPAEEFDYERRRFQSHEMLLEMTLAERQPAGDSLAAAQARRGQARALSAQAGEAAARGDHRAAIRLLEEGTRELTRALQALGLALF